MFKKYRVAVVSLALAVMLGACAPAATPVPPAAIPAVIPPTAMPSSVTVTDSVRRIVTITGTPQRIVSLAPSTTEIAFALGLANRIVAVDTYSDYPPETKDLPKLKTFPTNLEQLVSYQPDLVLAAGVTLPDEVQKMQDLKLKVLVVGASTASFDDVFNDILLLGKATGTETQAQRVTGAMKQKVEEIKARVANAKTKPSVYWEMDVTDPAKPFTPGPGSFIDDLIKLAGGTNIAAHAKSVWAQVNAEEIIAANPDIIILSDTPYGVTVESVKARPGWGVLSAAKNGRVLPIEDNLVSRPGPRVADGLEAAARLIHPELFK